MRPNQIKNGINTYECFECGARVDDPDTRTCPGCGGELLHLGRSRDL
ncbi:MAG: rubrerythrin-like domain-containing protein [Natronomonas sp.]